MAIVQPTSEARRHVTESTEANRRARILCVDDERPILGALRRLLRRAGYDVLLANSGREALDLLESEPVDLLISDMRMPQMSGAELLEQVASRWPLTQRLLLTGQADINATISAINEGRIFRYLHKPWDDHQLLDSVAEALRERDAQQALKQANSQLERSMRDTARELTRARRYDPVTQLPNRSLLLENLQAAIAQSEPRHERLAVLMLGLDRFHRFNASLGLEAGDSLLRQIAQRIGLTMFNADTIARAGGNRFCIVVTQLLAADEAALLATLLLQQVSMPLYHEGQELFLSASVGISLYPADGTQATQLLGNAESALVEAKRNDPGSYRFYNTEMNCYSAANLTLEAELRLALERGEFRLHYQPQVSLAEGRVIAAEALLRWQHPERGLVSPAEFIPLLEESGLIEAAGLWVIDEACAMLARLRAAGHADIGIAINLSARQFAGHRLQSQIEQACARHGIAPDDGGLKLEITENLLMQDSLHTEETLRGLHDAGFEIAIDDFGTGYSSLSYLARFPISCVKIDRSFVVNVEGNRTQQAIIAAVASLTQNLDMQLICEGVEDPGQLGVLRELGCEVFQGYLFGRPQPEADFFALLAAPPAQGKSTEQRG